MSSVLQSDYFECEFVWEDKKKVKGYTSFPDQK
jgi:predicted metal-dependent hydrolase